MKLSVVIAAYNERLTIREIVARVRSVRLPLEVEILIVDDFSTDGTRALLTELAGMPESSWDEIEHRYDRDRRGGQREEEAVMEDPSVKPHLGE